MWKLYCIFCICIVFIINFCLFVCLRWRKYKNLPKVFFNFNGYNFLCSQQRLYSRLYLKKRFFSCKNVKFQVKSNFFFHLKKTTTHVTLMYPLGMGGGSLVQSGVRGNWHWSPLKSGGRHSCWGPNRRPRSGKQAGTRVGTPGWTEQNKIILLLFI